MKYRKLVLLIAIGFVPLSNQQVAAPHYTNWHEELSDEAKELIDFISVCRYKSISAEPNVQEALCNGPHAPQGSWSATDGLECPSFPYEMNWCVIDEEATDDAIRAINESLAGIAYEASIDASSDASVQLSSCFTELNIAQAEYSIIKEAMESREESAQEVSEIEQELSSCKNTVDEWCTTSLWRTNTVRLKQLICDF